MPEKINKKLEGFHIYKSTHDLLKEIKENDGRAMARIVHNAVVKFKKEMEGK